MVADPRFAGGTSAALIADVEAFVAAGASVGLMPVRSAFLDDMGEAWHPGVRALLDHAAVREVAAGGEARAETAFLHHPAIFYRGTREQAAIRASRCVLVAHQTPFRGDGSIEYDPIATTRRVRRSFGMTPLWAPISGVCRAQLACFAPLIRLTREDWYNVFDVGAWQPARPPLSDPTITLGRHGRPDRLKWPDTAMAIACSLPEAPGRRIRVMGLPDAYLAGLGVDMAAWEVVPFGAEPVRDFLDGLDVFVFHHHPMWVETFGRVVAEALLMGRVCVLDPAMRASFGDVAAFASPAETPALLSRIEADRPAWQARAAQARDLAAQRYAAASLAERHRRLAVDRGTCARDGADRPWPTVLRKLLGHRRRGRR